MTEPPRPPGDPSYPPPDPTSPQPPPYSTPGEPAQGYPPPGAAGPQYPPPGYPPPGAYQQQPYGTPPPAGFANSDEKTWALVAHFGGALGMFVGAGVSGWIAPLIALLAKGKESPTVRAHAVAALNFQIVWSIVGAIGWITVCIVVGGLLVLAAMALGIIFGVVAGLKANDGQLYKYPMSINMVK